MFCTTIVPTINRPTLSRTVLSVLNQAFDQTDHELIVVNDSGEELPYMEWQSDERVRVIDTYCRERSVARNTGAAIAKGKYLHFLDDDDFILPGALRAFRNLDQSGGADWMFGAWQTVDNYGNLVDEFRPGWRGNAFAWLVAGESLPLQASMILSSTFYKAGTFDALLASTEDRDLERRIALVGDFKGLQDVVAVIRIGEQGSTTVWSTQAENDRIGREKALNLNEAFHRLRASANSSYLRGRVSRAYLASSAWNLKRKQIFNAASRLLAALVISGLSPLSGEYWEGLSTKIQ